MRLKTGDKVIVITGSNKGKEGTIKKVLRKENKVIVEGVNIVTKAQKANPMAGIQGGLNKIEAPLNASKVMVVCPSCEKATRIKHEIKDGKKVRVCKKCNEVIDI